MQYVGDVVYHLWIDLLFQAALILLILFMFLIIHNVPQRIFSKLRLLRRRPQLEARRHFVRGAQLLSQARSSSDRSLAAQAAAEADAVTRLDPGDAAAHVLRALALELQGFGTSALDALDAALSPLAAASLSHDERGEALLKRAELRLAAGRGGVVEDVAEAVRLIGDCGRAHGLIGELYERDGLREEARKAYEAAIRFQPDDSPARYGLARLQAQKNSL